MKLLGTSTLLCTSEMLQFLDIALMMASGIGKDGDGINNELSFKIDGDYTQEFGFVRFSNFTTLLDRSSGNLLNNVWY